MTLDGERQEWTHLSLLCSYYCIIIITGAIKPKKSKTLMQNFPKLNTISTVSILVLGSLAVQLKSPPELAQTKTDIVQQKKQSSGSRLTKSLTRLTGCLISVLEIFPVFVSRQLDPFYRLSCCKAVVTWTRFKSFKSRLLLSTLVLPGNH